jgi:hypothetical protein
MHVKDRLPAMLRAWATQRTCAGSVYTGDALAISEVLSNAPIEIREILLAHFVAPGDAARKARELEISRTLYWSRLDNAYWYLAGALSNVTRCAASSARGGAGAAGSIKG